MADGKGKSFTPLNAARGPRAAHPVAALGRPSFANSLIPSAQYVCFNIQTMGQALGSIFEAEVV
jgi:hypothetical protein